MKNYVKSLLIAILTVMSSVAIGEEQPLTNSNTDVEVKAEVNLSDINWRIIQAEQLTPEIATAVNKKDRNKTALHYAVVYSTPPVVRKLIELGADIGAKQNGNQYTRDFTPLHNAAGWRTKPEMIYILMEGGADINARTTYYGNPSATPLHTAARNQVNKDIIRALVELGANLEDKNKHTNTPLIWAAVNGNQNGINVSLELGANAKVRTKNNRGIMYVGGKLQTIKGSEAYKKLKEAANK